MSKSPVVANRLLAALPSADRTAVLAGAELITLTLGLVLCEANQPYEAVYFPQTASISVTAEAHGHTPMETVLIGAEGMLGVTVGLDIITAPLRAVVHREGSAWRVQTAQFQSESRLRPRLMSVLHNYLFVQLAQLSQSVVCSRFHEVEPRLARSLLMCFDRAQGRQFLLTHQQLANNLGVRRSAVTIAAGSLQTQGLITYSRGEIRLLDLPGLQAASCACYALMCEQHAQRLA